MRPLFRRFFLPFYRRWALWYIRRERVFRFDGLRVRVPPGVFHPGVFFSTPIFLSFLQKIDFQGKTVLDVGTGSGVLALFAARCGARVTALDIHPLAVATARNNARGNGLEVTVVESDLLDRVPARIFDVVLINPPYYPRLPRDAAERAFFAGENLEYFEKLFRQLPGFLHSSDDFESSDEASRVWMILSEDCDLEAIRTIAGHSGFGLRKVYEKKKWGERFHILSMTRNPLTRNPLTR